VIEIGITKKQHYVSQGILKHFADQQKKIYELFIDKSIVTKKSIVDTMSQNYVYEHSKIEKNSIEDLFAKFESKAFPLIDSLITEIEEYCRDGDNIIPFKDKIAVLFHMFCCFILGVGHYCGSIQWMLRIQRKFGLKECF